MFRDEKPTWEHNYYIAPATARAPVKELHTGVNWVQESLESTQIPSCWITAKLPRDEATRPVL